jgi:hypothetical protein
LPARSITSWIEAIGARKFFATTAIEIDSCITPGQVCVPDRLAGASLRVCYGGPTWEAGVINVRGPEATSSYHDFTVW